jgi:phosphomannomutase
MSRELLLFDVDNTLTVSRGTITPEMKERLIECSQYYDLATVSGSDFPKLVEQIGDTVNHLSWVFTENGLVSYKKELGDEVPLRFHAMNFVSHIGEEEYKRLVNTSLRLLSELDCPVKRGTFLELRTGLLNICPIGRSCSQQERDQFEQFDQIHKVRSSLVESLQQSFPSCSFSIGGQISIDVFPKGWNKTYCLQFIESQYDTIHFFGDKILPGGNDYEIGTDFRVKANPVMNWMDTYKQLGDMCTQ